MNRFYYKGECEIIVRYFDLLMIEDMYYFWNNIVPKLESCKGEKNFTLLIEHTRQNLLRIRETGKRIINTNNIQDEKKGIVTGLMHSYCFFFESIHYVVDILLTLFNSYPMIYVQTVYENFVILF